MLQRQERFFYLTRYCFVSVCELYLCIAGHSNLANHARTRHSSEEVKIKHAEAIRGPNRGPMGNFVTVTKIVSAEAKNVFG